MVIRVKGYRVDNIKRRYKKKKEYKIDIDKLICENTGLVHFVANKYQNLGLDYDDLIGEGNIGLINAAKRYDPSLGYKFSTYATLWIRQAITRALSDKSRTIKIPVYLTAELTEFKKVSFELHNSLGREPELSEIAKKMKTTVKRVEFIKSISSDVLSLDEKTFSEDDKVTLKDTIADTNTAMDPYEYSEMSIMNEDVKNMLNTLTDKEKYILKQRFGLNKDEKIQTLEAIGNKLGITRERVRQIEKQTLNKLKTSAYSNKVKGYIK